ncbi:hypothetical protein CPB84DRAFT_1849979 [Gymnopilus junonius]|uniref:Uncharacterized protein n=1 Tax=Gymnopilus junonius TaxID=109634 RepID=A0A9P5TKS3_GYMJU|nr:hypothetical protein CPB84DRAFT_1849979 [Gymnopilus junonius]
MPSKSTISFFQGANNVTISGSDFSIINSDRDMTMYNYGNGRQAPRPQAAVGPSAVPLNVDLDEIKNVGLKGNSHQNGNVNASLTAHLTMQSNINLNGTNAMVSAMQGYDNDNHSSTPGLETVTISSQPIHFVHTPQPTQRNSFNSPNLTQPSNTSPSSQGCQHQCFTPGPFNLNLNLNPNPNPNPNLCPGSFWPYAPCTPHVPPPPPPASCVCSTVMYVQPPTPQATTPQATTPQELTPPGIFQVKVQGEGRSADVSIDSDSTVPN